MYWTFKVFDQGEIEEKNAWKFISKHQTTLLKLQNYCLNFKLPHCTDGTEGNLFHN